MMQDFYHKGDDANFDSELSLYEEQIEELLNSENADSSQIETLMQEQELLFLQKQAMKDNHQIQKLCLNEQQQEIIVSPQKQEFKQINAEFELCDNDQVAINCELCSCAIALYLYQQHYEECKDGSAQISCHQCNDTVFSRFIKDHLQVCIKVTTEQANQFQQPPPLISKKQQSSEDTDCSICFLTLCYNDPQQKLICGHSFHIDCIAEWKLKSTICPNCRAETEK